MVHLGPSTTRAHSLGPIRPRSLAQTLQCLKMGEKRFAKVTVDIAPVEKHGYAVVLFNSPPVNTLSSELMTEIRYRFP